MRAVVAARIVAISCVLAVLSCGSKGHQPHAHQVAIRAMQFVPPTLTISIGDTVVWTNEDIVPHTATAAGTFDSQTLASKQAWRYTATTAGEFAYGCTFHPTMKAILTVR